MPEAYHLEAINSDPMLGFFSEPIKIYFLIWSVSHSTSRCRRSARAMADKIVAFVLIS